MQLRSGNSTQNMPKKFVRFADDPIHQALIIKRDISLLKAKILNIRIENETKGVRFARYKQQIVELETDIRMKIKKLHSIQDKFTKPKHTHFTRSNKYPYLVHLF